MNYDCLKKDTYLFLLGNSKDAKKLVYAILLISLCHDNCIKDNELFVTKDFIKKCCSLIPFEMNYEKFNVLTNEERFSLIRNKLAHGDFVYNEKTKEVYIKHIINNEEVFTSIRLNNIISFAKEISTYFEFLKSGIENKKIVVYKGIEMTFVDNIVGSNRTDSYRVYINKIITDIRRMMPQILKEHPERKRFDCYDIMKHHPKLRNQMYDPKKMTFEVFIDESDWEDTRIMNSRETSLMRVLWLLLGNHVDDYGEYMDLVDLLVKFYVIFIYPLENFLKKDDYGVLSLQNDNMFDFSLLNIQMDNNFTSVSKTLQYKEELNKAYQKLGFYHSKVNKLKRYCGKDREIIKNEILLLEKEIDELKELFCNNSVRLIYEYSKNRSIIEHLRCSIMHGTYSYDYDENEVTFINEWHGKVSFNKTLSLNELNKLFNKGNTGRIIEQFYDVYSDKKTYVKK